MKLALALVSLLAACSGSKQSAPKNPTPPASSAVFELGEITMFEGTQAMLKIHANGTTELGGHSGEMKIEPGKPASTDSLPIVWKAGPTISTTVDGKIEHDGKWIQLQSDGTFTSSEKDTIPVLVTADAITIQTMGATITLGADGTLNVPGVTPPADKRVHIEGADTAGKRRLALTFVAFMLGDGAKRKDAPPPEPAVVTPAQP